MYSVLDLEFRRLLFFKVRRRCIGLATSLVSYLTAKRRPARKVGNVNKKTQSVSRLGTLCMMLKDGNSKYPILLVMGDAMSFSEAPVDSHRGMISGIIGDAGRLDRSQP